MLGFHFLPGSRKFYSHILAILQELIEDDPSRLQFYEQRSRTVRLPGESTVMLTGEV